MQKYLLLLLLCLVGTIEAQAGIKVEPAGTGSYILTFTNTTDGTVDWNSPLLNVVKSATSVKIVTEEGYKLTSEDMKKITGEQSNVTPFFSQLKSLDLADAELKSYDDLQYFGFDNNKYLETFAFPKKTTTIPLLYNDQGIFQNNKHIKTVLMYEDDDTGLSLFKRISDKTFMGASNLTTVRIPEGVEEIGVNAFGGDLQHPAPAIESIHFPNTLKRIEENAFEYCRNLKSVTIPQNVAYIGYSAFQWNTSMTDVYVLGNNVKIANGAFNQEETFNFEYHQNGDVDFSDWKPTTQNAQAGTTHPLILHVPNDDTDTAYENYINPFLKMLNDPAFDDEDGNNVILNALDDNIESYPTIKARINQIAQQYGISTPLSDCGIFKRENWVTMKTSADGRLKRYFKTARGLFNSQNEVINSAYGGWRNFMLVACDVDKKVWPDGRLVDSRWYSAVFPFSMSYNQVMTTYGVGTDVREFTYVNKHIVDGQERRTVTFSTKPTIPDNDRNKEGYITKGIPYMIHPGVRSVDPNATRSSGKTIPRTIAGVNVEAANNVIETEEPETVSKDLVDGDKPLRGNNGFETITKDAYIFKGTYKNSDIPANSFYLGYEPPTWPLAYYVTKVTQVGKWNAFTSIVQKVVVESSSQAKTMDLGFSEVFNDVFGIATEIELSPVVENRCESYSVYNLNGQMVRVNNGSVQGLSKGIYVVNGKKIVVK